jgi:hypothetical protein
MCGEQIGRFYKDTKKIINSTSSFSVPQPRFAPSYSKTRIIADGINTIASHFSTLPHPTRHNPGPAASSLNHSSLSIISHVPLRCHDKQHADY